MRLPALALCMLVVSAGGTFITTGREDFIDEDPRLLAELRRRMNHDQIIKSFRPPKLPPNMFLKFRRRAATNTDKYEPRNTKKFEPRNTKFQVRNNKAINRSNNDANNRSNNETSNNAYIKVNRVARKPMSSHKTDFRRRWGLNKPYKNKNVPMDRAMRHKVIDLTEQAIYGAQYRLKDLEPIIKKYEQSFEYRISYIFKRLEWIEKEMERTYSYLAPQTNNFGSKRENRMFHYIIYYEDVLAKHVDVTYICERLGQLYQSYSGSAQKKDQAELEKELSQHNMTRSQLEAMGFDVEAMLNAEQQGQNMFN